MSVTRAITILIAEDQSIIRLGPRYALQAFKDIAMVGESADGLAAVRDVLQLKPDVVLMDIGLPIVDGIQAAQQIKAALPNVRIIMFTTSTDEATIVAAMEAGADGYCFKDIEIEKLYRAVKTVASGMSWLDPGIAERIIRWRERQQNKVAANVRNAIPDGADAETQILDLAAHGPNMQAIARQFGLQNLQSELRPGTVLAECYLIDCVLGRGGMGIVYKAKHLLMDRCVAIKMLRRQHLGDALIVKRFQSEAKSLAALSHPGLVTIFDYGMTHLNEPYLVMDFHDGLGLDQILLSRSKITVGRAVNIFSQICAALTVVHECNIIHRDIRPSNILISANGLVKLIDFGIARSSQSMASNLTVAGQVMGTPNYMSPEQCLGRELDARSDIYALGCVMYQVFTGKPPFSSLVYFDLVRQHVEDLPSHQPSAELLHFCPELEAIIFKCLAKDPERRYKSAAQLNRELTALTAHAGV